MLKSVTQPVLLRSGLLISPFKYHIRTMKWELKCPPVDPSDYLPKLKKNQINVPVFERRFPWPIKEEGSGPHTDLDLDPHNWVYDRIIDKARPVPPSPEINVILVKNVTGVGVAGTKLRMKGNRAYRDFILPQLAVYASPANEAKYKSLWEELQKTQERFSSVTAEVTILKLERIMLQLLMNMNNPWKVENWHVRVAFRRMGVIVPDDCIELPSTPITGPDINKEGKHFFVTIIINNKERVPVVCRLGHFTNNIDQSIASVPLWTKPFDPLFEEDSERLKNLEVPTESDLQNPYISGFKPFTVIND